MFFIDPDKLKLPLIPHIVTGHVDNEVSTVRLDGSGSTQHHRELHYLKFVKDDSLSQEITFKPELILDINKGIEKINDAITIYNSIDNQGDVLTYRNAKIEQLRAIAECYQTLDDTYYDRIILWLMSYQAVIYDKFTADLARQRSYLMLTCQYEKKPRESFTTVSLAELFAESPLHIVMSVMEMLVGIETLWTRNIYSELNSPEAQQFSEVLDRYSIMYIGGSNSKCFSVEDKRSQEIITLKVENLLNHPKCIERKLRKVLEDIPGMQYFILPIYFERRSRYFCFKFGHTVGRLILTKYCNQGNLRDYMLKNAKRTVDHLDFVMELMLILGEKLECIQQNGFAHPDLKPTNILAHIDVNSPQKVSLHISDCKAIYECTPQGELIVQEGEAIITTRYASAPESNKYKRENSEALNADRTHVYQLGRCLYECLISCDKTFFYDYLNDTRRAYEFDESYFRCFVFHRTKVGQDLKELIQSMVVDNPQYRILLNDALIRLKEIKVSASKDRRQLCEYQLDTIATYQFATSLHIKDFVRDARNKLKNIKPGNDANEILNALDYLVHFKLRELQKNAIVNHDKQILQKCTQEFELLLAADGHGGCPEMYESIRRTFQLLESGEAKNYRKVLQELVLILRQKQCFLMGRLRFLIQESRAILNQILLNRFGENDLEVIHYVYDMDRLLEFDSRKAQNIINLNRDIKQMLARLNTKDLNRIRKAIQKLRMPEADCCGVDYFFQHKRRTSITGDEQAQQMEMAISRCALMQRDAIRSFLESEGPEVQRLFQTVAWPLGAYNGRVWPIFR